MISNTLHKIDASHQASHLPDGDERLSAIAIIGMACRVPGADDVDSFWRTIRDGIEAVTRFTDEELLAAGVEQARLDDPNYVKAKAVLPDIAGFDAGFFGFTPREAEIMDPQQRCFLECAWAALEQAGYDPECYQGAIGLFAGASLNSYLMHVTSHPEIMQVMGEYQVALSNDKDHLTTRAAYKLNLTGPCVSVQTSCSTSLVAVHLACQSLLDGECDMALAGGVSIRVPHKTGYLYQEGSIFSPDGHCRAFDANAQGTIEGHGAGLVVLKRLQDALADGDHVVAVIRGSAINNDGALKVGYTAPSEDGQATVIAEAQAIAETPPDTISYIEAHGTGTPIGDPIEVAALTSVFRTGAARPHSCALGSVKPNIGHLDAAAGVAGLIKAALMLKHRQIPPLLHFTQPNPKIDFANSPFYVNTTLQPWHVAQGPRRAGVSSFGIGGTNAHVIVEEAPMVAPSGPSRPWHLLTLSARSRSALEAMAGNLAAYLRDHSDLNLADVAYTLQCGRRAFEHRLMLVCRDGSDAVTALETADPERILTALHEQRQPPIVLLFPGQGAQYVQMGADLYQTEPVYRAALDRCATLFMPHLHHDLRAVLYPETAQTAEATALVDQTAITQPALFAVEYALAQMWLAWGVRPHAMIGHSIGEYVAACLAGVLALEDAVALVAARGRMMQDLAGGSMLAVTLSEEAIQPFLDEQISLAAINSPMQCVVAGTTDAIVALQARLVAQGVQCRDVRTSHAFHSAMMDAIVEPFIQRVSQIRLRAPQIPYISNVSGTWITATQATDPRYWGMHLRQTVRFAAGLGELLQQPQQVLLEVGPGQTLSALVRRHPARTEAQPVLASLRHPDDRQNDVPFLLSTVGRLWLSGVAIDWRARYQDERRQRVPLPTYPFEHQHYWIERRKPTEADGAQPATLARQPDIADWMYVPVWQETPLLDSSALTEQAEQPRRWLIFADGCGVGAGIARRVAQQGHMVVIVRIGQAFARIDANTFAIDPRQRQDYSRLFDELRRQEHLPTTIVHCWSVTADAAQKFYDHVDIHIQTLSFDSLLYLAQTLGEHDGATAVRIGVVANQIQDVTGLETLVPEKALALGPCRVMPQEYTNVTCQSIDIAVPQPETIQAQRLVDALVGELTQPVAEPVVAYRGRHRWVQTFKPVRLPKAPARPARLREGGVYLIADGMSLIGLALAEYLAQTAQATVVLLTPLAFPDASDWEHWLATHDEQDLVARTIRTHRQIEQMGGRLVVLQASLSDESQVQAVVGQVRDRFDQINGVIQAATTSGAGLIQLKTPDMAAGVFASKIQGTRMLATALQDMPLDFFVLFSSTTTFTGGIGLVDVCAANAFLEAFARDQMVRSDTPTIAINWSQWQWDDWQEALLAGESDVRAQLRHIRETYGMTVAESVAAFSRALDSAYPQLIVSPQDFTTVIEQLNTLNASTFGNLSKRHVAGVAHHRPALERAYVAPSNEIEQIIAEMWQDLFGIEQVGIHDNFFELGGNSLNGIQLVARLRSTFQVDLAASSLFESPTVAGLARLIADQRLDEAELDDIDQLLREIELLSPEEAQATLAAELGEAEGAAA